MKRPLIVLTADLDMENAVKGLISRARSLGIRTLAEDVDVKYIRHPNRDSGCCKTSHLFLRGMVNQFDHALVVFDYQGCGDERKKSASEVESEVESSLQASGWMDNARAIVIDPELEAWVWSASPQVDAELGWKGRVPKLREWLVEKKFLSPGEIKPQDPKAAMEAALRQTSTSRSAKIFSHLAQKVSMAHCTDRSFNKLRLTLKEWFYTNT